MNQTARKLALPVAFLAVGLPVGVGVVMAMGEDAEEAERGSDRAAFKSISTSASDRDDRRAEARWERVASFSGTGRSKESFDIADGAIQWRA